MKFLAVDMNSVFRRQWEAAEGKDFGTARTRAVAAIQDAADGYDRIVVCRDAPPSFRKAIFAGYKAGRPDPGEAFREQLRLAIQDMRELGASVWASPSLGKHEDHDVYGEADDVIASFALWYQDRKPEHPDWRLRIMTGDTDLWALVDDQLSIDAMTLERKVITAHEATERYGVAPYLIPEIKALAGDGSDEYFPFQHPEKDERGRRKAGIGPATAAQIVLAPVERGEHEVSSADAVLRSVLADQEPGVKLNAPAIFCLRHHGVAALELGRQLARLRPLLRRNGDTWDTLDFSLVLDEPKPAPRRRPKDPEESTPATTAQIEAQRPVEQSAALVVQDAAPIQRAHDLPFAPQLKKMMMFAGEMYDSGIFRKELGSPAACLMLCEYARAFRVPAVILAQHAGVVRGKMGFGSQVIMAIVLAHPSTRVFRFTGDLNDPTVQRVKYHRAYPDGDDERGVYKFTIEMARVAGFLDGKHSEMWAKRPNVMLGWAAARECARKVWPDITTGIHGPDEIRDRGMTDDQGEFPAEMLQEDS